MDSGSLIQVTGRRWLGAEPHASGKASAALFWASRDLPPFFPTGHFLCQPRKGPCIPPAIQTYLVGYPTGPDRLSELFRWLRRVLLKVIAAKEHIYWAGEAGL